MGKKQSTALLAGVMLMLLPFTGFPQPGEKAVLTLSPDGPEFQSGRYYFHDYLYAFIDSTENRPVEEVAADSFQQRFTKDELWRTITFGGDMGPNIQCIWARLTLVSAFDDDQQWLVNFFAEEVDLYIPRGPNSFEHQRSGYSMPVSERAFGGSYGSLPCVPLTVPARDTLTVFFRLKNISGMGLGPRSVFAQNIFKPRAYFKVDRRQRFFDAMAIGIMLAVAFYHLVIFMYQRRYVPLFFSFLALGIALIIAAYRGYLEEVFFPSYHLRNDILVVIILWSYFYLFHYLFSRLYLRLPTLLPAWDKIWLGFVLIEIVGSVIYIYMILSDGGLYKMNQDAFWKIVGYRLLSRIPLLLLSILVPILSLIKGNRAAWTYLIAMLAMIFQLFINDPNAFWGLVPIRLELYEYSGHTIMVLLFAMGIASQLKTLQEEKFAAEQAEQAERAEANRIRELDVFKSRFYTNITHQFRTPLTIILGMAGQIQAQPSTWYNKGARLIRSNGRRLLHLVDQILNLSKLEAGQLPTRFVHDDVMRYLKYIVESFHSSAEQKNIKLEFETEPKALVMDYDPDKLMDILSNLASNAIKFTQEEGVVTLNVTRHTSDVAREATERLVISVTDNGPGIPEEIMPRIFDRFYQAGQDHSGEGGAGIGLALTQELVHILKGEITVKSELGKGTTFTVTLPITHNATAGHDLDRSIIREMMSAFAPLPDAANGPDGHSAGREKPTVLLVEDNPDVVEYIRSILPLRFHLEAEYNGKQGLAKACKLIPDIIISDIMMPEMDGLEMCRLLKADKRTSHIPIILLTAKVDMASKIEGLQAGGDAYLAKPFDKTELLVRINKLTEMRAQLQERYRDLGFLFQNTNSRPEQDTHPEDHFMRELHAIIESNLADPDFSIGQLGEQIGMSRATLYRKFKAITNLPLSDFIRRVRLHKARQLLESGSLKVTEVAMDTGFKNLSTFSRSFREEFGISPSEARHGGS
ncbi:MAG: response regulator [Phaeodactylibacter sp.]|nr:response regulator [Phaeodactylibacter sp.]MCB9273158.1 response regulator [Lewinellaceae bacterium]